MLHNVPPVAPVFPLESEVLPRQTHEKACSVRSQFSGPVTADNPHQWSDHALVTKRSQRCQSRVPDFMLDVPERGEKRQERFLELLRVSQTSESKGFQFHARRLGRRQDKLKSSSIP